MPTAKKKSTRRNPAKHLGRPVRSDARKAKDFVDGRKSIWYVGMDSRSGLTVFKSRAKPTKASHGHRFVSVTGPMTEAGAHDEVRAQMGLGPLHTRR